MIKGKNFKGKSLESWEEVIASVQDHWITVVKLFLILIIGWSVCLFLGYVAFILRPVSREIGFIILLLSLTLLLTAHHLFFALLYQWEISSLILTTKQMIIIRFLPFIEDDFEFVELDQIHTIEKKKHGVIRNILNYGEVLLGISGKGPIELSNIRRPTKFVNFLETIKFGKPLAKTDISGIGAACSPKYNFLLQTRPQVVPRKKPVENSSETEKKKQ